MTNEEREAVKRLMIKYGFKAPDMTVTEFVEDCLPSVTPQQKIGHWEVDEDRIYTCNQCNKRNLWHSLFCPNCGARMEV